jgi:RNA polymerase sigma-70 factor, ECF subfamily
VTAPIPRPMCKMLGDVAPPETSIRLGDEELVSRARSGERWAEEALYARYAKPLLGLATRLLANTAAAEDVVHDTFLAAFTRLHQLREGTAFAAWLHRIAIRKIRACIVKHRLLSLVGLGVEEDATFTLLVSPDASPEVRAELSRIETLLKRASATDRMAWTLHHVEGETLPRVAELLGVSLATAKRRIAAADAIISKHVRVEVVE